MKSFTLNSFLFKSSSGRPGRRPPCYKRSLQVHKRHYLHVPLVKRIARGKFNKTNVIEKR